MPRAVDGNYSLPAGTLVNSGDTIMPSQHNPAMQDIAASMGNSLSRDGQGGMRAAFNGGGFKVTNIAVGTEPTDAVTVSQLSGVSGVPVGCIVDYAGAAAPTGWLFCAGQILSRTEYAALFAAIGTTYGAPNASTFNLPDLRGRLTAGRDIDSGGLAGRLTTAGGGVDGPTLGAVGGAQNVTLTEAQMPAHTHPLSGSTSTSGAHSHNLLATEGGAPSEYRLVSLFGEPDTDIDTQVDGAHSHTLAGTASTTGGGTAHGNVQPTIILNRIIKAT